MTETVDTKILNKLGLHARASAKLTQLASKFDSDIFICRHGRRANAKSIMGVMMLSVPYDDSITIETSGPDEKAAIEAIISLIEQKFGEEE